MIGQRRDMPDFFLSSQTPFLFFFGIPCQPCNKESPVRPDDLERGFHKLLKANYCLKHLARALRCTFIGTKKLEPWKTWTKANPPWWLYASNQSCLDLILLDVCVCHIHEKWTNRHFVNLRDVYYWASTEHITEPASTQNRQSVFYECESHRSWWTDRKKERSELWFERCDEAVSRQSLAITSRAAVLRGDGATAHPSLCVSLCLSLPPPPLLVSFFPSFCEEIETRHWQLTCWKNCNSLSSSQIGCDSFNL